MRKGTWLGFFLLLAGGSAAQAQVHPDVRAARSVSHPLTVEEAQVVLDTVRSQDQQPDEKPDCSHLVHELYTLAGYPYPYARSLDLYVGIRNFVRVARPQPGDLIVWRGHVGIVVEPAEHSFYSSVSDGLRTEFYDQADWKKRGRARFYRYVVANSPRLVLTRNQPASANGNAEDDADSLSVPPTTNEDSGNARQPARPANRTAHSKKNSTARRESASSKATSEASDAPSN